MSRAADSTALHQTNAVHRMAYIEENMKQRRNGPNDDDSEEDEPKSFDPQEELFKMPDKYKIQNIRKLEEGSVSNSVSMLTAIPEVDLGME